MEDFPKCENCGGPIVPDDIGPVWVVTVVNHSLPNLVEDGKCTGCGRPLLPHQDDEDDEDAT
jgi:hypothetical protein